MSGETGYFRLQLLLREDILSGRISAGERLKVSDVAARYGTSTNPAREALQGLEGEGLVVIAPNKGARVRPVDDDFVNNIFELRGIIEPHLVRGFAEYATGDEVGQLSTLQQACDAAVADGSYPAFHASNVAFHDYIIARHHNREAARIMTQHAAWVRALSRKNPLTLAQMRRSTQEHRDILDAIRCGDPAEASAAATRHIQNSSTVVLGHMRRERASVIAHDLE